MSAQVGIDLSKVFDQYLRTSKIPTLEYYFKDGNVGYRWTNSVSKFDMPVKVKLNGTDVVLKPTSTWKVDKAASEKPTLEIDKDFYVASFNITE